MTEKSNTEAAKKYGFWGECEIPLDEIQTRSIGPLKIWFTRDEYELRIACSYTADESSDTSELPEGLEWQRWAFKQKTPKLIFRPVFPDRPVVVKPEAAFRVAEDAAVRIYVRVPIWVRVLLSGRQEVVLQDIPTVTLSNTWFGSFAAGELSYWLTSGARRTIEPDPERPYLAICPIQIVDKSPEDLDVEEICLHVGNLSLFLDQNNLWADETRVIFKGASEPSRVEVSGKAPAEAKNGQLISGPRQGHKKGFSAKTFASLKELPGLGFFSN